MGVGKREKKFIYTYSTIANIVGLKAHTVWLHGRKNKFNPHDLDSVVGYINYRRLVNATKKSDSS